MHSYKHIPEAEAKMYMAQGASDEEMIRLDNLRGQIAERGKAVDEYMALIRAIVRREMHDVIRCEQCGRVEVRQPHMTDKEWEERVQSVVRHHMVLWLSGWGC